MAQRIIHPLQDRVPTIRENARLQGFPECSRLHGLVKHRYVRCDVFRLNVWSMLHDVGFSLQNSYIVHDVPMENNRNGIPQKERLQIVVPSSFIPAVTNFVVYLPDVLQPRHNTVP